MDQHHDQAKNSKVNNRHHMVANNVIKSPDPKMMESNKL